MERNGARPILAPMNISWSDLNNVQDAGDYPFRDGTISVTFAEIAIWKKNPDAQFRLMRKHPIQSAFKYVLGRQIEENLAADDTELIYESSNGDSWCLTRDPVTGAQAVMHRPNPQSGGQVSYIEIETFLSEGANGPEHQALRRFMETSPVWPPYLSPMIFTLREVEHMTTSSTPYNLLALGGITLKQFGSCNALILRARYAID
jgi:hypothetical protein